MPLKSYLLILPLLSISMEVFAHAAEAPELSPPVRQELDEDFNEWLRCSRPGAENCEPCAEDNENLNDINRVVGQRCLPPSSQRDFVFNVSLTPEQQHDRDDSICACYTARPSRANIGEQNMFTANISRNPLEQSTIRTPPRLQEDLDEGVISERIQAGFSAASYRSNTDQALQLGIRYSTSPRVAAQAEAAAAEVATKAGAAAGAVASRNLAAQWLGESAPGFAGVQEFMQHARRSGEAYTFTAEDFNGPNEPGFCIPYRHFLASKQFPTEKEFYTDLQQQGTNFRPDNWNYVRLLEQLRTLRGSRDIEELNSARSPEIQRLLSRMRFLHNNPVIKNIFLSQDSNSPVKQQLFTILRGMPAPDCATPSGCIRDENWTRRMADYRGRVADFLTQNQGAASSAQEGFEVSLELNQRLKTINSHRDAITSSKIYGSRAANDPAAWANFCFVRVGQVPAQLSNARDVADLFGERDFAHPKTDKEYSDLNAQICRTKRRDGNNRDVTFDEWSAIRCASPNLPQCLIDNRTDLVAEYLNSTTDMNDPKGNVAATNLLPILNRTSGVATVRNNDVRTFNDLSQNSARSRSSPEAISQTTSNSSSQKLRPLAAADLQGSGMVGPSAMGLPQSEQVIFPQARAQAPVEETRAALAEGESEERRLLREIASLRENISRQPASADGSPSPDIRRLSQQMDSLRQKLEEREKENDELREEIAEAEDDRESSTQRFASRSAGSDERRRSPAAQSASQGGSSSGSESAVNVPLGGSNIASSSVAGRTLASAPSRVISSGNAALLSKYGVQSGSVQGAIIVANPSAAIDYQSLRSQSDDSVLPPVTLTPEEFSLVASNNQEALRPYFDRCRAMAGEVCRLSISSQGTQNAIELFLLKNGNEISIVPSNTNNISAIAAVPRSEVRTFMLSELEAEIRQNTGNQ